MGGTGRAWRPSSHSTIDGAAQIGEEAVTTTFATGTACSCRERRAFLRSVSGVLLFVGFLHCLSFSFFKVHSLQIRNRR